MQHHCQSQATRPLNPRFISWTYDKTVCSSLSKADHQDHHHHAKRKSLIVPTDDNEVHKKKTQAFTFLMHSLCFNVYVITVLMFSCGSFLPTVWVGHVHNILSYIQYCTDQDSRVRLLKKAPLEVRHNRGGGAFFFFFF